MKIVRSGLIAFAAALAGAGIAFSVAASAAEITVLASPAVKEVYIERLPIFEQASKDNVTTIWAGTVDIVKRIRGGEVFDLVILPDDSIDQLIKDGKIVPGSRVDLAKTGIGMATRAGVPKPDIATADALKRTLLAAASIGYSNGPSGAYLADLFNRMGIIDAIKPKLKSPKPGAPIGVMVANGEVEIGFQALAELLPIAGIDVVALPPEVQHMTMFSSGILVGAKAPDAAKAFVDFLKSPAAVPLMRQKGLEPG